MPPWSVEEGSRLNSWSLFSFITINNMICYGYKNYKGFKEIFVINVHRSRAKSGKNIILLGFMKNKKLLQNTISKNNFSLLRISNIDLYRNETSQILGTSSEMPFVFKIRMYSNKSVNGFEYTFLMYEFKSKNNMNTTAVIYARVSSENDRQDTSRQITDLKKFSETNDMQILKVYEEHISGAKKNEERRVLTECVEYCIKNKVRYLLLSELSRLGRSTLQVLKRSMRLKYRSISRIWGYTLYCLMEKLTLSLQSLLPSLLRWEI